MNKEQNILIIGAGLCGSLLALRLGQRGYNVTVMEKRPDLRKVDISAGRSINLAFSDRGNKAMKLVGLETKVNALCIPMNGRMIHDKEGNTFMSNYSGRDHEYINSISRGGLNALLLDEAEKLKNVTIHFNKKCKSVDFEKTTALFKDYDGKSEFVEDADIIIANNVFNHSDKPKDFLKGVQNTLNDKGVFVFELPYWLDSVLSKKFDQVYHEHVTYFNFKMISVFNLKKLDHKVLRFCFAKTDDTLIKAAKILNTI